ncbi:MAG TPA: VacB/RNase II family 3'-5' exoribonuclease [Candidatus Dormibacteraeota bacterium]|nr:VacB/RNase II family 3'-5' exoribonuclease [Candidatus Dormibacteraeota bacterium]
MKRKHASRQQQPPHPEEVTREQVVAHLETLTQPASIRQIAHGMGLRHYGRRFLPRVIDKLLRAGEIEETHGGQYRLTGRKQPTRAAKPQQHEATHGSAKNAGAPDASDAPEPAASPHEFAARRGRDPNLVSGRIVAHRDGYAFLVADQRIPGMEGDLFIGRDALDDAMHGDRVLARITRRRSDGRAEGRVVRIVERENPSVVGLFRYGPHGNAVLPYDTRITHEISIPPGAELTPELQAKLGVAPGREPASMRRMRLPELDGSVVNVEITRFPKSGLAPAGRVIEILGRPGEIGVDVEIIIRKHHLPHEFAPEILAEGRVTPQQVDDSAHIGRRDFRDLPTVTIDGETARDFDDAVYVRPLPSGHFELQVHIADVAHYVRRDGPLDREARLRGTSVYFPNRAVPMLPEELSNGICSLNPHVDRLVMSVIMEIDAHGKTVHADFTPGVIRSAERMTYTNVNKVLEGDPEMSARYAPLAEDFRRMKELALILNHRRHARGSIDFDLPEPVIQFDEFGTMTAILRSERNIAHRLIEEFMLAANEAVAEFLDRVGIASLYRVHEKPDPKKVLEFEELAQAFGYSLGVEDLTERRIAVRHGQMRPPARAHASGRERGRERGRTRQMAVTMPAAEEVDIRPQHYQRLTEKIAGKPEERILSYLMLRSLKQARYAAEPLGHFALGVLDYTHFTSPIRRYPDLIVHRALKWALEHADSLAVRETPAHASHPPRTHASRSARRDGDEPLPTLGPYRRIELQETASETSEAERRADAAERELMDWKTAQYMEGHLGEEYDALIISVQKFGFFVELTEIFVEGLVPIDRLEESTGLRCLYREHDHTIVAEPHRASRGAAHRVFHLGDIVRVRAERIEPLRRRVEFAVL